jgi:hypothetical protein
VKTTFWRTSFLLWLVPATLTAQAATVERFPGPVSNHQGFACHEVLLGGNGVAIISGESYRAVLPTRKAVP